MRYGLSQSWSIPLSLSVGIGLWIGPTLYLIVCQQMWYPIARKETPTRARLRLSSYPTPSSFPSSWYRVCNSWEVGIKEIKTFSLCSREVVVYRGEDGIVRVRYLLSISLSIVSFVKMMFVCRW